MSSHETEYSDNDEDTPEEFFERDFPLLQQEDAGDHTQGGYALHYRVCR